MQIIRVRMINAPKGLTKGCENAPLAVLNAMKRIESTENGIPIEFNKLNLEEIHVDLNNIEEANYLIYENSKEAFEKNFKTFFIGGDHSISYALCKAFSKIEKNPLIIIFDAHADCMEPAFKEPNHEDWLRKLTEENINPKNVILISARDFWPGEIDYIKSTGILWIKMEVLRENIEDICDMIMERARASSGFYISLDIDSVDPGFAPGTEYLEPGGLSSNEIIYFIKRLKLLNNFRGADIVEINPDKDINGMTVKLGAKLLAEMIK